MFISCQAETSPNNYISCGRVGFALDETSTLEKKKLESKGYCVYVFGTYLLNACKEFASILDEVLLGAMTPVMTHFFKNVVLLTIFMYRHLIPFFISTVASPMKYLENYTSQPVPVRRKRLL